MGTYPSNPLSKSNYFVNKYIYIFQEKGVLHIDPSSFGLRTLSVLTIMFLPVNFIHSMSLTSAYTFSVNKGGITALISPHLLSHFFGPILSKKQSAVRLVFFGIWLFFKLL